MTYGIAFFFNNELEREIYELYNGMSEEGISSHMLTSNNRPHITLAVFGDCDITSHIHKIETYCDSLLKTEVNLSSIGIFTKPSPCVFLSPTPNESLLKLHREFHQILADCNHKGYEYYLPDKWFPHCSIEYTNDAQVSCRAVEYLMKHFTELNGFISEFNLIDLENPSYPIWVKRMDQPLKTTKRANLTV